MGDNGDAAERRSAYAKASVFAEAFASAKATAAALCARTVKTADKCASLELPLKGRLCELGAEVCGDAGRAKAVIQNRLHNDVIALNVVIDGKGEV